jgi:2-desacetyl-2-hydroxyethyl bacteriochlorophyllide A dehydrogenase
MQAVVLGADGEAHVQDVPEPETTAGQVLIKVDYCGICGSDLHAGGMGLFKTGVVMGHEFAGEIVGVGEGVTWKEGDRVTVNPNGDWCGECAFCRMGDHTRCPQIWETVIGVVRSGGMAPYVAVNANTLHRLPQNVSTQQGAWTEPLAVAVRMVRNSEIRLGDSAVVFGAGPIGLLVVQMLRAAGAGEITVVEPSTTRGATAQQCGADYVVDPFTEDLEARFSDPVTAPQHAFECVGLPIVTEQALKILRPKGRLTIAGIALEKPYFTATDLIFKELEIRGSFIYQQEFAQAIELLNRGAVDVEALTSDVRPVAAAESAFGDMRRPDGAIKILLKG